jgi:hypothetical protein
VNSVNHGFDADRYLAAMPEDAIAEIHLAGFEATGACLIDTHGARVAPEVWALYRKTIARIGPRPTLIEWDVDIPTLRCSKPRPRSQRRFSPIAMPSLREFSSASPPTSCRRHDRRRRSSRLGQAAQRADGRLLPHHSRRTTGTR